MSWLAGVPGMGKTSGMQMPPPPARQAPASHLAHWTAEQSLGEGLRRVVARYRYGDENGLSRWLTGLAQHDIECRLWRVNMVVGMKAPQASKPNRWQSAFVRTSRKQAVMAQFLGGWWNARGMRFTSMPALLDEAMGRGCWHSPVEYCLVHHAAGSARTAECALPLCVDPQADFKVFFDPHMDEEIDDEV